MKELRRIIEQEIRERGPIPFSRYMELCLYHPRLGYYSRNAEQFGKAGDFYTSSDVHAVFGRLMARQFHAMWHELGSPETITLKELGAGRGLFARDVLDWSEKKFPDFFQALRYQLVEQSLALSERIQHTLKPHFESGKAEFQDFPIREEDGQKRTGILPSKMQGELSAKDNRLPTIIFANEFFDALPVEVLSSPGALTIDSINGRFIETWVSPSPEALEFLDRYSIHPEPGERVEVSLQGQKYMSAATDFERGFAVLIDYGYTREQQLAGSHRGTLKAIRQHSVSNNPYEAPGEQDITADVNFTALAAVARRSRMQIQQLVTQSHFLMNIGEDNQFADVFGDCRMPQERAKVALQLKHLITPAGMGESFQVLVASKGINDGQVTDIESEIVTIHRRLHN